MSNYKIVYRRGKYIVHGLSKRYVWWRFKWVEEWNVLYQGLYTPAHFYTKEAAIEWIKMINQPDVEYFYDTSSIEITLKKMGDYTESKDFS